MSRLILAGYILLMNILDVVTTDKGLALGAVEQNPLMVGWAGTLGGTIAKMVLATLALAGLLYLARRTPRTAIAVLMVVAASITYVVITNQMLVNELECEQVHREWLASDQPYLDWSTVEGCDGLG